MAGTGPLGFLGNGANSVLDPLNIFGGNSGPADSANALGDSFTAPWANFDPSSMPAFNSIYNPSTQSIGGTAAGLNAANPLDMSGIDAFKSQALAQGPSQWAQQAGQQQNYLAMQSKDQGAQTVAGQGATAQAGLASRGGLSSGAAERLAQGGANNYLSMTQGVNNQLAGNQMQIGMNDQQNKLSMMSQLPGMQLGAANFKQGQAQMQLGADSTDVANAMQGTQAQNTYNLGKYQTQMQGYGAGQTASATAKAGKHKKS